MPQAVETHLHDARLAPMGYPAAREGMRSVAPAPRPSCALGSADMQTELVNSEQSV